MRPRPMPSAWGSGRRWSSSIPTTGIEAFEFLEGYRACTNADFRERAIQSAVIDLYKAFNSGPPLPLTKTVFDMIDEHFAQARELGSHLPSDFAWLERRYEEAQGGDARLRPRPRALLQRSDARQLPAEAGRAA